MTENKRFYIKESVLKEGSAIQDKEHKYSFPVLESKMNFMFKKALNELNDECDFLETENESLEDTAIRYVELYHKSLKENERLKSQLYCDSDEGVCIICNHHYLEKGKTYEKYYILKCKKGHEECSKMDLKYCDDFELKEGDEE